jgi:hypothetical protein
MIKAISPQKIERPCYSFFKKNETTLRTLAEDPSPKSLILGATIAVFTGIKVYSKIKHHPSNNENGFFKQFVQELHVVKRYAHRKISKIRFRKLK